MKPNSCNCARQIYKINKKFKASSQTEELLEICKEEAKRSYSGLLFEEYESKKKLFMDHDYQ